MFRTAYETKIDFGSNKAEIVLPGISSFFKCIIAKLMDGHYSSSSGITWSLLLIWVVVDESEVSVFSLDEQLADYSDNQIGDFVSHASSCSLL